MDWKLMVVTFSTVFLAELGDKTQIAALAMSAKHPGATLSIWLGVCLALVLAGTLGVVAGRWIGDAMNPQYVSRASGVLFIGIGIWILWRA